MRFKGIGFGRAFLSALPDLKLKKIRYTCRCSEVVLPDPGSNPGASTKN